MLHRAYAPLAAAGLNYTAATQEEETTGKRLQSASLALVARLNGTVAGTIAYYDRQKFQGGPVWFGRDEVCIFAQFGVEPALQHRAIGRRLLDAIRLRALEDGKKELACDTAIAAVELVAYYASLGFRAVEEWQYSRAAYRSVVLSRHLGQDDLGFIGGPAWGGEQHVD
jgi:GNAT superfamily N-acetyltransferase